MNDVFVEQQKKLSLSISDDLSSLMHMNIHFQEVARADRDYKTFESAVPSFAFVGILEQKNPKARIIVAIDPEMIYKMSNLVLGGVGDVELKVIPNFTFSEEFIGKLLIERFIHFYEDQKISMNLLRIEHNLRVVHSFYEDEPIRMMRMSCLIEGSQVGVFTVCYPMD